MLHKINLIAGQWSNIGKTGRYVNIVLGAGEIRARIRKTSGQTEETGLIAGMAFEVPAGFDSVNFYSDDSQQIQVWLSALPLAYTPVDSKIVGASALVSSKGVAEYQTAREIVKAKVGRRSVSIQPERDLYIGGHDVSASTAVKVPANTTYKLDTQAGLFGYSLDPTDKITEVGSLESPLTVTSADNLQWGVSGRAESLYPLEGDNSKAIGVRYNDGVWLYDTDAKTAVRIDSSADSFGMVARDSAGNYVFVSGYYGFIRIDKNGVKGEEVTSLIPSSEGTANYLAVNPVNDNMVFSAGSAGKAWFYDGETTVLKQTPFVSTIDGCLYTSLGRLVFWDDSGVCYSDDEGETFSTPVTMPAGIIPNGAKTNTKIFTDYTNDHVFVVANKHLLRSRDNCESFEVVKDVGHEIDTAFAVGDSMVIKTKCFSTGWFYLFYSSDGGATWQNEYLDGDDNSYNYKRCVTIVKSGVALSTRFGLELINGGGEPVFEGGMNIGIMEEIN